MNMIHVTHDDTARQKYCDYQQLEQALT